MSDEQDTTPLLLALQNLKGEVCEDVVNLLVRGGADVNHRKSNGRKGYGIFVFLFFNARSTSDFGVMYNLYFIYETLHLMISTSDKLKS